jgi:DNA-3-methyladenine glycosylase
MSKILKQDFYAGTTPEIAQRLLGKYLCRKTETGLYAGKIVETEAYVGEKDLACHSARGKTARTEAMFGPAGHAYIYLIYGMYYCLNIVTQKAGVPEAVLIRSLEPLIIEGKKIEPQQEYYQKKKIEKILNGPGKLCREFQIGKELNGMNLCKKNGIWIENGEDIPKKMIISAKRIGVDYAQQWKDKKLRFYIRDSEFVSKK